VIDLIPSISLTINRRTLFVPFWNLPMCPSSACNSAYIPILFIWLVKTIRGLRTLFKEVLPKEGILILPSPSNRPAK